MSISVRLKSFLDENGVKYVTITHSRAYTAQEVAESCHVPAKDLAKTVMIHADGNFMMTVVPGSRRISFPLLKAIVNADEIRLATEGEFKGLFPECQAGAMPPFGSLYGLPVYADNALSEDEDIVFNAGNHTEAIRMRYADFQRLARPAFGNFTHV